MVRVRFEQALQRGKERDRQIETAIESTRTRSVDPQEQAMHQALLEQARKRARGRSDHRS
jgi:hypothetical protein